PGSSTGLREGCAAGGGKVDDKSQQVRAALARIWERSRGTVLDRVVVLEQAAVALLEGALGEALREQAEREAHKLAGSLGTFGFAHGSRLAGEMERLLRAGEALGQAGRLRCS